MASKQPHPVKLKDNVVTLFNAALKHHTERQFREALKLYDTVIRLQPSLAQAHTNRGAALNALGRHEDALKSCNRALAIDKRIPEALNHRAVAQTALNRLDDALGSFERMIEIAPENHEAHFNKGIVLRALGKPDEALRSLETAIDIKPDYAPAHNEKAIVLKEKLRIDDAIQSYDRAIEIAPRFTEAYTNRGNALLAAHRHEDALRSFEHALEIKPDFAAAHNGKGSALRNRARFEEALGSFDAAIALAPDNRDAHNNRGTTLKHLGRTHDALEAFDRAIALRPNDAEALYNKALCALSMGRFEEGLQLNEWRKKNPAPQSSRSPAPPVWRGVQDIAGRCLLVHSEHGLGDIIQFSRYTKLAAARGAQVVLSAPTVLMRLLKQLGDGIEIVDSNVAPPDFDYHIPLLSMPLAFNTGLTSIPADIPYLHAEPGLIEKWRVRLGSGGFRIGICWQGSLREADFGRSFSVRHFEVISRLPNVRLISLQKNAGAEQLRDLPPGMAIEELGDDFDNGPDAFVDTAAVMESLDLVITTDTAIAHLAGTLGRPTWIALQFSPDWRWQFDRTDSPWYPTAELFRQKSHGDWQGVFASIRQRLENVSATTEK